MLRDSMFDLLERIEKRPEMYVGAQERREQLRNLNNVLFGYQLALNEHCPNSEGDFLRDLAVFLMDRYGSSAVAGSVAAVEQVARSAEEAWDLFWTAVRDFKSRS